MRRDHRIRSSEITDRALFLRRRELLRGAALAGAAALVPGCSVAEEEAPEARRGPKLENVRPGPAAFRTEEPTTDQGHATSYNNFYELGTDKGDPEQLPGQRRAVLEWPYREGLRLDEALHPLAILAVGMYGEALPGQNGAPLRLVVPWKYGFKSIKSIVRIRLQKTQPRTTWSDEAPSEYGFQANVNPAVDHPRWSQAQERRIGDWRKRPTLFLNGYADEVGHLYAGMDLREHF